MSMLIAVECPYFPTMPGATGRVMAVMVQDRVGKYRAYIGIVPSAATDGEQVTRHTPGVEWVARQGRKLTYSEAVPRYFVGIKREDYAE